MELPEPELAEKLTHMKRSGKKTEEQWDREWNDIISEIQDKLPKTPKFDDKFQHVYTEKRLVVRYNFRIPEEKNLFKSKKMLQKIEKQYNRKLLTPEEYERKKDMYDKFITREQEVVTKRIKNIDGKKDRLKKAKHTENWPYWDKLDIHIAKRFYGLDI